MDADYKCLFEYHNICFECVFTDTFNEYQYVWPASVAQLDARPTGDQEVAGSTPAGSAIFFRRDLIMKYVNICIVN